MSYLPEPRRISESGRAALARAVAIDWDWALPASSFDKLAEALGGVSADDLEGAYMLAHHLRDTVATLLIRRRGLPAVEPPSGGEPQ